MTVIINAYKLDLNPTLQKDPLFKSIEIHTSRIFSERNSIRIYTTSTNIDTGIRIRDLAKERFEGYDVSFSALGTTSSSRQIRALSVNHHHARAVIENLYQHRELSDDEKIALDTYLDEMDQCVFFANAQKDTINKKQKNLLKNIIKPHLDNILAKVPEFEITNQLLDRCSGLFFGKCDLETFNSYIHSQLNISQEYAIDHSFYESLLSIGLILASKSDLEPTLFCLSDDRLSICSNEKIEQYVLSYIKKQYEKNRIQ